MRDEGLIADDLQRRLERMGYSVPALASSGEEALRFARKTPFDLAVRDNGIGARGGLQRTNERSVGSHIVAILAKQLDGRLTQQPGPGTHLVLKFPVGSGRLPAKLQTESERKYLRGLRSLPAGATH